MPDFSKKIVYLSQAQYQELITNDTITVDGVTINYNENDIYVTPQAEPVTDVKINGTSIVANGVANIPVASLFILGTVRVNPGYGIKMENNMLRINEASNATIRGGTDPDYPIVSKNADAATFYGLAKAAGADMKDIANTTVGIYPDEQKSAIQSMLGISNLLAPTETTTASKAYSIGEVFTSNGKLYKATAAIAAADAIVTQDAGETVSGSNAEEVKLSEYAVRDVQVNGTSVMQDGVANLNFTSQNWYGILMYRNAQGQYYWYTYGPSDSDIKAGNQAYRPITTTLQHKSTFYGLAKAAGADMASISETTVGIYPDAQKAAIQHMLGTDTNLASYESDTTADQAYAIGELFMLNGKLHQATAAIAIGDTLEVGTNCTVVNAAGVFTRDVQVNGTSVVSGGVANVPKGSGSTLGVFMAGTLNNRYGIQVDSNGVLQTSPASNGDIKAGNGFQTCLWRPIVPAYQHYSAFYGLAKAAGDTTQSASSNAVGVYTSEAKIAIKNMLDIQSASISITISGTTPTIIAQSNARYVCSEISTLDFTPCASGICEVIFTSGSTAAVLTVPNTVKFPEWFDATSLDVNTIYDISIVDGVYAAVMTWAV